MGSNATPALDSVRTTKRGIDLATFEDVLLVKDVPKIPKVTSVQEALSRLGNNSERLLEIITDGLQAEAVEKARNANDGWIETDDDGKPTGKTFAGQLANSEDVNPVVLMFAKMHFGYEDAKNADQKRAAKQSAKEMIKGIPQILDGLQKKAAASKAQAE